MEAEQARAYAEWKRHQENTAPTECRACSEIEPCSERGLCSACEHKYTIAECDNGS